MLTVPELCNRYVCCGMKSLHLGKAFLLICYLAGAVRAEDAQVAEEGTWSVTRSDNKDGGSFCQVAGQFSDGRTFALLTSEQTYPSHTLLITEKEWPDMTGQIMPLLFQSAKDKKWQQTYNAFGANNSLSITLTLDDLKILFSGISHSGWLILAFPSGSEEEWVMDMGGFAKSVAKFKNCVSEMTETENAF